MKQTLEYWRAHSINLDRVDHVAYAYPSNVTQFLALFTLATRELNGLLITGIGIASEQWDFFGVSEYLFARNQTAPIGLRLNSSGGATVTEAAFYTFKSLGDLNDPTPAYAKLEAGDTWNLVVKAGASNGQFAAINLYVRTVGYLIRGEA